MLKAICKTTGLTRAQALHAAVEEYAAAHGVALDAPKKTGRTARAPATPATPAAAAELPRLFLRISGLPEVEVLHDGAVVGSSRRCEVWINMPHVETRHARLFGEDGRWVIEDLNSEAGTFHDGRRIKRRVLSQGDEVSLAGFVNVRFDMR
jgi:pSer/pThr/pTyr-binding forkhead associated (FHA) protein